MALKTKSKKVNKPAGRASLWSTHTHTYTHTHGGGGLGRGNSVKVSADELPLPRQLWLLAIQRGSGGEPMGRASSEPRLVVGSVTSSIELGKSYSI